MSGRFDSKSTPAQRVRDRFYVFRLDALNPDSFAANRARDEERSRLDTVGNDIVLRAMQLSHAFDDHAPCSCAFVFRPLLFRKFSRSTASGSCAAPSITVVPCVSAAAIITLSVPRTVGPNLPRRLMTAPVNFGAKTFTLPPSTRTAAPSASNPLRCRSIGRSPMMQPPGIETVASLQRPSSGPSTQTEARILRTTSYGAIESTFR